MYPRPHHCDSLRHMSPGATVAYPLLARQELKLWALSCLRSMELGRCWACGTPMEYYSDEWVYHEDEETGRVWALSCTAHTGRILEKLADML